MKPVRFDPFARSEFLEAIQHYEEAQKGLGREFRSEIENAIQVIRRSPRAFGSVANVAGVRRLNVKRFPYYLPYLELADRIQILAVAHSKRQPGYWSGRVEG
ncbi:MAG: type II toxin-antitoxin system RelE/ParE family toxin [Gemmataceae bacterium]